MKGMLGCEKDKTGKLNGKYHVDKARVAFKGGKKCVCSWEEEEGLHMPPGSPKTFNKHDAHQVTPSELCPAPAVMHFLLLTAFKTLQHADLSTLGESVTIFSACISIMQPIYAHNCK